MMNKKLCLLLPLLLGWGLLVAAQESEEKHDPEEYLSRTLPVLYINTDGEQPVVSKEEYIQGEYWLDAQYCDRYESVGSEQAPLGLKIRGRGNATWKQYPKKPYRLKLDKKASLLGMPKSKHWALLAAYADWRCHARDYTGFTISRLMQMPWTPGHVPCEVVLNGDYIGMYFLTENIRVAKERVNITEQRDLQTDPDSITGGWLLEIDNNNEVNQIRLNDKDGSTIRITHRSPEELSNEQRAFLTDLLNKMNDAINTDAKNSREWERYIDIDALARFYIILEAVDDQEAFIGSCWFYKDMGQDTKFIFGPVWDFGGALGSRLSWQRYDFFYHSGVTYEPMHWIEEICKFPRFQIALRKYWRQYRDEVYPQMEDEMAAYRAMVEEALKCDARRWNDLSGTNMDYYLPGIVLALTRKMNWLRQFFDEEYRYPVGDVDLDGKVDIADVNAVINIMLSKEDAPDSDDEDPLMVPDVNGDGKVDIADVNAVINAMLGKTVTGDELVYHAE